MTFRDLTRIQIAELERRCQLEKFDQEEIRRKPLTKEEAILWDIAYTKGLKAGLEVERAN